MTHPNDSPSLPHAAAHPAGTASHPWQGAPAAKRSPVWLVTVGVFFIMALLLSFQQVVQGVVKQGAERHKTTALLASATRTCKALRDVGASERCSRHVQASSIDTAIQTAFFSNF